MPTTPTDPVIRRTCKSCGYAPCKRNAPSSALCAARRKKEYQAMIAAQEAVPLRPYTAEDETRRAALEKMMIEYLATR